MELITAKGRLMIIGGGEDRDDDCLILREFVKQAGGDQARIVVLTTATKVPEKADEVYRPVFERFEAAQIDFFDVSTRSDATRQDGIDLINNATGIFFTGGKQFYITSLMGGSMLQAAIFEAYEKGVIVAGTSAGGAMMGSAMIIKGESKLSPRLGCVEIAAGSSFITNAVIDTHFSQRGRHGRLLTAVAHFPQNIGFGIDENTAMFVSGHHAEVLGEGAVTVFDASKMTYSDVPYVIPGQSIALANVIINVLPNTYKFDLKTRELITPKEAAEGSKEMLELTRDARTSKSARSAG
jgi:cyanophycinase